LVFVTFCYTVLLVPQSGIHFLNANRSEEKMAAARSKSPLEEKIRTRAHEIWQREGHPEGRHLAHWQQAEAEIAAETSPKNSAKSPRRKASESPAKSAPKPAQRNVAKTAGKAAAKPQRKAAAAAPRKRLTAAE
jgi:hypothetical protein